MLVNTGVSQGLLLDPVSFQIYIHDVTKSISKLAEDATVLSQNPYLNCALDKRKFALKNAEHWFALNHLSLNDSKTQSIILILKNLDITENNFVNAAKFLGVYILTLL